MLADAPAVRLDSQAVRARKRNRGDVAGPQGQTCQELTTVHGLPADTPLFRVPAGLRRILDRDLQAAHIAKRDNRGRTVDVHALRHTFGRLSSLHQGLHQLLTNRGYCVQLLAGCQANPQRGIGNWVLL